LLVTGWEATAAERRLIQSQPDVMPKSNHTSDPTRGDFDEELARVDPKDVQIVEASADRAVSIQVIVSGERL
jgi:hypothetical protein